ncbi:MAG: nucleoside hydrolase [Algoriphagus sp.]|uniref:nucleoside hydrolase n=1 Tax=Algoriphagus sp. TaxID=1872435 RepID=UPI00260E190B|nr:nucleoside hydrolase [Algoriphagus sp.]MDG1276343.1 nucleoside hydrolase [Algoriphagus sp.]
MIFAIIRVLGFFSFLIFFQESDKTEKLQVIIDADTANEVDDLYALARAIEEPNIDLIAITSAQFHTSPLASDSSVWESQEINEKLVELMGRASLELPLGANAPIENLYEPQISEASTFIVNTALSLKKGEKLDLVILGSCTNVVSAILQDPSIISRVRVHYLGFWHDPKTNIYNLKEFNSGNDTLAVRVLLETEGLDLTVMSATTSQNLVFEKRIVDQNLKGKSALGDYLVDRWETFERWWTKADPEKTKWTMWDLAIIEALIHPEWTSVSKFTTPEGYKKREIKIHTAIDREAMEADFWQSMRNSNAN